GGRRRRLHASAARRSVSSARPRPARGQGDCRAGRGVGGRGRIRFREPLRGGPRGGAGRSHRPRGRGRVSCWAATGGPGGGKGEGQIGLISGEPGIGKSRLVAALAERIAGKPHTRLRYNARPTTPTARFVRSSPSWSERRRSRQTIRPSNASTSWKRSSLWTHRGSKL